VIGGKEERKNREPFTKECIRLKGGKLRNLRQVEEGKKRWFYREGTRASTGGKRGMLGHQTGCGKGVITVTANKNCDGGGARRANGGKRGEETQFREKKIGVKREKKGSRPGGRKGGGYRDGRKKKRASPRWGEHQGSAVKERTQENGG